MKKKLIISLVIIGGTYTNLYPELAVQNLTDEVVWARINDQKRQWLTEHHMDQAAQVRGGTTLFTLGMHEPITGAPFRVIKKAVGGYPNFIAISPKGLTWLSIRFKLIPTSLIRIHKVTFLRLKGFKEVTGTAQELKQLIDKLTSHYGNIQLSIGSKNITYLNDFYPEKKGGDWRKKKADRPLKSEWPYQKNKKYTIKVPILESFIYDFGKNPIMSFADDRTIRLKSWANVDFSKFVKKRTRVKDATGESFIKEQKIYEKLPGEGKVNMVETIPLEIQPIPETRLRRWIQDYKKLRELRAKRKDGNASPAELKKLDEQMSTIKKAAAAAGMAAAFIAGIAVGRATKDKEAPPAMQIPVQKEIKTFQAEEITIGPDQN